MLDAVFRAHPRSVGESYLKHLGTALSFAVRLLAAGGACLVHAFVPALFERTGSRMIARLHEEMVAGRTRRSGSGEIERGLSPR